MKAVILAGGLGTRLSEETATRPKPMVEIGGRPILWHILKHYSYHGINDFVICCGYQGYVIQEFLLNFCLTYGDGVSDVDISASIKFHKSQGKKATLPATYPPARFGALDLDGSQV